MMVLSTFERRRIRKIQRNAEKLIALGLDPAGLTTIAIGPKKRLDPEVARKRRPKRKRVAAAPERVSERILGIEAPNYADIDVREPAAPRSRPRGLPPRRAARAKPNYAEDAIEKAAAPLAPRAATAADLNPRSIRNLDVGLDALHSTHLGEVMLPAYKRTVMQNANSDGTMPRFSRMSGIQEWSNAVMLFVNVFVGSGDCYKNVFLDGGRQITWFAQNRQWEGTPVVQRLIHSSPDAVKGEASSDGEEGAGSAAAAAADDVAEEEEEEEATPVLLFCREEKQGYVFCGRLRYVAHDPDRLPIRFVWELVDYDALKAHAPFNSLLSACEKLNKERLSQQRR
jgi:hypothetical protein